jgi:hypothetical protein
MKQEVIRNFLNLPGIIGVALIDGQARHFFMTRQHQLNWQQKDALSAGVRQIISTTPPSIDCFEFQFNRHRIYTYKIEHTHVLLVLATKDLEYASYFPVISLLKSEIKGDMSNAIASFRLAVSDTTTTTTSALTGNGSAAQVKREQTVPIQSKYSSPQGRPSPPTGMPAQPTGSNKPGDGQPTLSSAATPPPSSQPKSSSAATDNVADHSSTSSKEKNEHTPQSAQNGHTTDIPDNAVQSLSIKEALSALNQFSRIAARYLGTTIVSNYWKSSRPAIEWLSSFEIDRKGHITFSKSLPNGENQVLNQEQHEWLSEWLTEFIQRCSSVIRNFPSVMKKMDLTQTQRSLLLPDNP